MRRVARGRRPSTLLGARNVEGWESEMRNADIGRNRARAAAWLVTALLLAGVPLAAQVVERVLAVVDGRVITLLDVQAARDLGLVDTSGSPDPVQTAVSALIDRALILDEVDRYSPPEPDAASVERGLARVRSRFPSEQAFEQALARTGMELFGVQQWVRNDLRIESYLDQRFASVPGPGAAVAEGRSGEAVETDRREALVRDWLDVLRARARITRPSR
jgi:hypothetical protein